MNSPDDQALLGEFVRHGSQQAFRALVERYAGLVFSSACRQVRGDEHLAEDVTQAVFIVLARRAGSISDAAALPAWLIKATHFVARDLLKMQARRRKHERKAAEMMPMQLTSNEPTVGDLEPVIDAALAKLKGVDRNIVTRRYLQQQSVEQVAVDLKMTEAAVRKRLSRALPKLRSILCARGVTLSLALLAALLDQVRPSPADAALIDRATTSALSRTTGTPSEIAHRLIRRIFLIRLTALATAVVLVLMTIVIAGWSTKGAGPSPGRLNASTLPKIKVGILVSDYSANTPNDNGVKNSYLPLGAMLKELDDPALERFAVIEPGTAQKTDLARMVGTYFPPNHTIVGSDAEALRKLDVIVCPISINMRDDVLNALIRAVSDGVGILNQCATGCNHPGLTEPVNAINGMTRFGCFYNDTGEIDCTIAAADHALMSRFRAQTIHLRNLSGSVGIIREGQALITAPGLHNHHPMDAAPADAAYYPLYVATLGKGRIIGMGWGESQPAIDAAGGQGFYVRCVRWLAHREAAR
jgi:RNA polymerase sigma factor (sigma-70 family)